MTFDEILTQVLDLLNSRNQSERVTPAIQTEDFLPLPGIPALDFLPPLAEEQNRLQLPAPAEWRGDGAAPTGGWRGLRGGSRSVGQGAGDGRQDGG